MSVSDSINATSLNSLEYYAFADSLADSKDVESVSEIIRQDMRRYSRNLKQRQGTV